MCTAQNCIEILRIRRVKQRCQLLFGCELSAQQANCLNCEQNKRIIAMCYCRRCVPRILNVSLQGQRASASHRSCCQLINNSLIQLNQLQTAPLLSAVTRSLSSSLSLPPVLYPFAYWLLVSTFDNATMQFVTGNGSCCCDCDCDIGHVQTACDIKERPRLEWQATSINCESVNKMQQQKSERNHNAELCQQQLPQP